MDLLVILVHHAPLKVPRQKNKTSQQPDWRQTWSVCVLNSEWIWPERLYFRSNLGDQSWLHLNTVAYAGRCKRKGLVPGGKPQIPFAVTCFRNVSACCNLTDINFHMWGRKLAFKTVLPGLRIKLPWIGNFVDTNEKIGCAITKRLPGPPDSPSKVKLSPTSMTTRSAVRTKAALAEMAAWHLKEWGRYLGSLELNEAG